MTDSGLMGNGIYDLHTCYKVCCVFKNREATFNLLMIGPGLQENRTSTHGINENSTSGYNIDTKVKMVQKKYRNLIEVTLLHEIMIPTINFNQLGYTTYEYEAKYWSI